MPALFFGSISTLADTSEVQRAAFNEAFASHGLDWSWDQEEYRKQLEGNGGQARIADYAEARGEVVDAAAVHAMKSELFQAHLREAGASPRDGVAETIEAARSQGLKVALVTTTSPDNVRALLDAIPGLGADDFDLVVDTTHVEESKPHPAAYSFALQTLGEDAGSCVAVEDNVGGVRSALDAGVRCIAFPNTNTAAHDFAHADLRTTRLDPDETLALVGSR